MGSLGHVESYISELENIAENNNAEEIYNYISNKNNNFAARVVVLSMTDKLPEEYHNKMIALGLINDLSSSGLLYLEKFK
jgi:ribonucleotide reductase beta subunit family protein with ferritin-like domain